MIGQYFSVKNKYYLNGFDWVMGIIDLIMRNTTCAGNASQIAYLLDAPPDETRVRESLAEFLRLFPIIWGTVSRHYTLTPYWKMPKGNIEHSLPLTVTRLDDASPRRTVMDVLTSCINTPFPDNNTHLAFHLVYGRGEQALALTFDHRLFDARGAESFISLFQQFMAANGDSAVSDKVRVTQDFDLRLWKDKFLAGRTVNRKLIALSKDKVRAVPVDLNHRGGGFRYRVINFDREETKQIIKRAYNEAGYLMIMPYLFAQVAQGMHKLFEQRGVPLVGEYVVPVSTDMRRAKDIRDELFFNHNSMFFFQVKQTVVSDRKQLLASIRTQLYEQFQDHFPEKLEAASSLMRIVPLWMMERLFHLPLGGKIASFCFSHVSKDSFTSPDLLGVKILDMFHMPRTPVPPGIGVFFTTYGERLHATISCLDGLFSNDELDSLERDLRCSL